MTTTTTLPRTLSRPFRVVGDLALGVVGLAIGAALYLVASNLLATAETPEPVVEVAPLAAGSPGAASAVEAVGRFLDAELAGESQQAWALLSDDGRLAYPNAAAWADRQVLGSVVGWEWVDRSSLTTRIELEPGLSLTNGWTPNAMLVSWQTTEEDGHRVALAASVTEPVLIDTAGALSAADAWLADAGRCTSRPTGLAPTSAVFDRLCRGGGVSLSESVPASGQVAVDLSLAYGSGVDRWARTVPLETGESLVLAAIGSDWVVIDAVAR